MASITGNNSNNNLNGTSAADLIKGLGGNDYLNGHGGNDTLDGGIGDDKLDGGSGNDTARGGAGKDFVGGGTGNDLLYGDAGDDYLWDIIGANKMYGGDGNDRVVFADEVSTVDGGAGNDTLVMIGDGIDYNPFRATPALSGGSGIDTLELNVQNVQNISSNLYPIKMATVFAHHAGLGVPAGVYVQWNSLSWEKGGWYNSNQNDAAYVSGVERITISKETPLNFWSRMDSDFHVTGGSQSDRLQGGPGNDTFVGGGGADHFVYGIYDQWDQGNDKIVGFKGSEGDEIHIAWDKTAASPNPFTYEMKVVEKNGHTIFTSFKPDGTVFHTLDVDATGLGQLSNWMWF